MNEIFFEKQEGALCAQHCLNALLQGSYFTAVDLGELASQLDETERQHMAVGGVDTPEYINFMNNGSTNMDDSGFFSIQVLSKALQLWGLEFVPINSTNSCAAVSARESPVDQQAFICNFRQHWFAIRKLGTQWFNLNSLLKGPELISQSYLSLFLAQLQQEGYSIFIVLGQLPFCAAHEILLKNPVQIEVFANTSTKNSIASDDDPDINEALLLSQKLADEDDVTLQRLLRETGLEAETEFLRQGMLASGSTQAAEEFRLCADDDDLKQAIALSLQSENETTLIADADDIRRKRAGFLTRFETNSQTDTSSSSS